SKNFVKKVKVFRLTNRKYLWEKIYLNLEFKNKKDIEELIIKRLKSSLKYLNYEIHPSNPQMPILYLTLKGIKPSKSCKINEKDLKRKICHLLPLVDVKIYQKFGKSLKTLDSYIIT
ncbi:MAG: hypothetical protein ACFE75_11695, partial [Candidatus Hodarchaeota archaeon]